MDWIEKQNAQIRKMHEDFGWKTGEDHMTLDELEQVDEEFPDGVDRDPIWAWRIAAIIWGVFFGLFIWSVIWIH